MLILGQVKGIKEEVETMTRKKEKVADLLGANMEEHSGLVIEEEHTSYKRKLQQWRDEALCREIELVKLWRDEEATTKQRQIVGDNLLKSAPLVKFSGPEYFLSWLSAVQTVIKKLPIGFKEIRLAKIIKDTNTSLT